MRRATKGSQLLVAALVSALVGVAVASLRYTGFFQPIEYLLYDRYLRSEDPTGEQRILLVEVTEEDIASLESWPVSDARMAELLQRLIDAGAVAIGVDIYRNIPVPPGSDELDALLVRSPEIVMTRHVGEGGLFSILEPAVLTGTEQVGFNDLLMDADGTVRRGLLFIDDDASGATLYSLPLRLALLYLAERGVYPTADANDPNAIRLGPTTLPPIGANHGAYVAQDSRGYQFMLDYAGNRVFPSVTLSELLAGADLAGARGAIVLVGSTAQSTNDFFRLPIVGGDVTGVENAGVTIHMHTSDQLVRYGLGESVPRATLLDWHEALSAIALALAGGGVGWWIRSVSAFAAATTAGLALTWGVGLWLFSANLWVPVVAPGVAWISSAALVTAYRSRQERIERDTVMHLFGRHVSPNVAEAVWQRREEFMHGGRPRSERADATLLFVDMKGYSTQAEKMEPQELIDWANDFLSAMARQVVEYGGFVDDYVGDEIKASFGVPFPSTSDEEIRADARAAVSCALDMEKSLHELNAKWKSKGLPTVGMRIGIDSGPIVAGTVGTENRLKFTVVGDVVVTAKRLESLDKKGHEAEAAACRILISDRTRSLIDARFSTEEVGEFILKGKETPLTVHRVTGGPASRGEER